jgi:hypothetical protein
MAVALYDLKKEIPILRFFNKPVQCDDFEAKDGDGMDELSKLTIYIEPKDIVNRVLDEEEYKGKTLREWADSLTNPKTNADRIRAMTDEELAKWLARIEWDAYQHPRAMTEYSMRMAWLDWLKSPVEDSDG